MKDYVKLRKLRNEMLYGIVNLSGFGTRHNMPFTMGCDIVCRYGDCKFISEFEVEDDTRQDSVYVLTEDKKIKTINIWGLNYDKNFGLDVSISDLIRMFQLGGGINIDVLANCTKIELSDGASWSVVIDLSLPIKNQPKVIKMLLENLS